MKKRSSTNDMIRDELEKEWEQWDGRKTPADTANVLEFFNGLAPYYVELLRDREPDGYVDDWNRVKYWLLAYESRRGRNPV